MKPTVEMRPIQSAWLRVCAPITTLKYPGPLRSSVAPCRAAHGRPVDAVDGVFCAPGSKPAAASAPAAGLRSVARTTRRRATRATSPVPSARPASASPAWDRAAAGLSAGWPRARTDHPAAAAAGRAGRPRPAAGCPAWATAGSDTAADGVERGEIEIAVEHLAVADRACSAFTRPWLSTASCSSDSPAMASSSSRDPGPSPTCSISSR